MPPFQIPLGQKTVCLFLPVLGILPRTVYMTGKGSATEPHPTPPVLPLPALFLMFEGSEFSGFVGQGKHLMSVVHQLNPRLDPL